MDVSEQKLLLLSALIQLEHRARHAESINELHFIITNESLNLINYKQAILWSIGPGGGIKINAVSGVDRPDGNSPFVIAVKGILKHFLKTLPDSHSFKTVDSTMVPDRLREEWDDLSLEEGLWCPLLSPKKELLGGLLLVRKNTFEEGEITLLERLTEAYGHSWWALKPKADSMVSSIMDKGHKKKYTLAAVAVVLLLLAFFPVRLSVLAPAEIVPADPFVVSVPMDGVVKKFEVEPNQKVEVDQPLFSLDDTSLRNEYELSRKTLDIAKEEYKRAIQKGFSDEKSRAEILMLEAQISQKSAYVSYMAENLKRSSVKAEKAGIIVFNDINDWIGKPVVVGEKIADIADTDHVEAEIMLPVVDAINLSEGAEIKVFLNVEPDKPLSAALRKAAYEAMLTPDNILAFRIKASLNSGEYIPRIGLRGTAKIYGERVSLGYFIFRRPLSSMRQFFGI